jgi:uncharacterized membrane protein
MIQLPVVIARVAGTLAAEIAAQDRGGAFGVGAARGPSYEQLLAKLAESGAPIRTPRSGYLQVVRHDALVKIATAADAVVQLPYPSRPQGPRRRHRALRDGHGAGTPASNTGIL